MEKIKNGDIISVNYTGKLDNQVIFDASEYRGPLVFKVGNGDLLPMFEESVIGMEKGESKSITIDYKNAYGEYQDELVFDVEKSLFPENVKLEDGMPFNMQEETGEVYLVRIKSVKEESVTIDANHPLAGQNLNFDITVLSVNEIEESELHSSCGCGCEEDDADCCGGDDDNNKCS
ncbi:MAG: hypothetical protein A2086_11000, partial [Spirochaetes bacterium GWD1_27_9]